MLVSQAHRPEKTARHGKRAPFRTGNARGKMNRFCLGLEIALLLLPAIQGSGQRSSPTSVLDEAGALQSKLSQWRQTLNNLDLRLLPLTDAQRQLLKRQRSTCLESLDAVNRDVSSLQSESGPQGEVRLHLDADRLQGRLFSLHDSLNGLNILAFRSGNQSMVRSVLGQVGEIGGMASVLENFFEREGQVTRQLDAVGVTLVSPKPQQPGAISGHVYRADTGKPLGSVTVMLGLISSSFGPPFRTVQTKPDGAYTFGDVPPGQYRVGAYLKGFTHGQYGPTSRFGSGWATINLASGQELSGIDVKLHLLVSVRQMNEGALAAEFPTQRFWLGFGPGYFSPDGEFFAVLVSTGSSAGGQVWLYDLMNKHLMPATPNPPLYSETDASIIGWVGDTVYAKESGEGGSGPINYFAAAAEAARQISAVPAAVKVTLNPASARKSGTVSNGRFTVSAISPTCEHCTGLDLTVRPAKGGKPYVIAEGSWELDSFIFELDRSLVIYPTEGFPDAIISYALDTRHRRLSYLPNGAQHLLAARPEHGGYLVAYTSYGPCQGYGGQGGLYPVHPQRAPYNVCFAKIPFEGEE